MSVDAALVPRAEHTSRARSRVLGGAWLLSSSMVLSGGLAYAFQILAARTLGPDRFGEVAVLWGATFLIGIVLFRPLEQTVSRTIADRVSRREEVASVLRAGWRLYVTLTVVALIGFALAWRQLSDRLFSGDSTMTALLALSVAGYGIAYFVRGIAGGSRWFAGYAMALCADGGVRLLVALPLVVVASRHVAGVAIAAAAVAGAAPGAAALRRVRRLPSSRVDRGFDVRAALRFAGPAAIVAGADQLLVNGAPLLVMLDGGAGAKRAAGVVFAATMLVRVPVYVFQGLAASLLPNLTHAHTTHGSREYRALLFRTAGVLAAAGVAIVIGAAALGPPAMHVLFGDGFTGSRSELALLGAGVAGYLAAATISQALLAANRVGRAAVGWGTAAAVFVAVYALAGGGELGRIAESFAIATAIALVLLALVAARAPTAGDAAVQAQERDEEPETLRETKTDVLHVEDRVYSHAQLPPRKRSTAEPGLPSEVGRKTMPPGRPDLPLARLLDLVLHGSMRDAYLLRNGRAASRRIEEAGSGER